MYSSTFVTRRKPRFSRHQVTSPSVNPDTNTLEFDALGTHWWIELLGGAWTPNTQKKIVRIIQEFHSDYTRFDDSSYIGRLNAQKYLTAPPKELRRMLECARDFHAQSNGVFNISVGGELARRGYGHTGQGIITAEFWNEVKLTPGEIRIPGEISIDLGGLGKGWLIDKISDTLGELGYAEYIVNGGGDLRVCSAKPIEIALEHPYDPSLSVGTTKITCGALGVSSAAKRRWRHGGVSQHHLIDPRTGAPSESDIACTFVRASTATVADICATILCIAPELESHLSAIHTLKTIILHHSQLSAQNK